MAKAQNLTEADKLFDQAEEKGEAKTLIPTHRKFEEPGDRVTGYLRGVETCTGEKDGTYKRYVLDTTEELISFVCGAQVDAILGDGRAVDKLIRVTFLGKESLKKGRTMNKFDVKISR